MDTESLALLQYLKTYLLMPVMEPQTTLSQQCNCKADLASTGHGWPFPFCLSTWRMQVPPDKCKPATGLSWFDHFKCERHGSYKT